MLEVDGELEPYLTHLRALSFVRGVRVLSRVPDNEFHADHLLSIRTAEGEQRVLVDLKKTHLTRQWVERSHVRSKAQSLMVFAPTVGRELGDLLEQRRIGFMDRAGNCYLNLSDRHVARIQGKRAERRPSAQKAMRAPAYRALFALLAEPALVMASVRALAEAAGVSRQAAMDIRHRLQALGILYETRDGFGWVPHAASKAIDLFVVGYTTTLRPQLVLGRYRPRASAPHDLEREITSALSKQSVARWGGGAACMRLTGYYRGDRTILHVNGIPHDLLSAIQAIPDRHGPLELVRFPGPLGVHGATAETAHPLLVYAELSMENDERAREAAREILDRHLPDERFT